MFRSSPSGSRTTSWPASSGGEAAKQDSERQAGEERARRAEAEQQANEERRARQKAQDESLKQAQRADEREQANRRLRRYLAALIFASAVALVALALAMYARSQRIRSERDAQAASESEANAEAERDRVKQQLQNLSAVSQAAAKTTDQTATDLKAKLAKLQDRISHVPSQPQREELQRELQKVKSIQTTASQHAKAFDLVAKAAQAAAAGSPEQARKLQEQALAVLPSLKVMIEPAMITPGEVTGDQWAQRLTQAAKDNLQRDADLSVWLSLYAAKAARQSLKVRSEAEATLRRAVWRAGALPHFEVVQGAGHIMIVSFSPDGNKVATVQQVGRTSEIEIWHINSGHRIQVLPEENQVPALISFSPDGKSLFEAVGWTVRIWDLQNIQVTRTITDVDDVKALAFHSHLNLLALAGQNEMLDAGRFSPARVWDLNSSRNSPRFMTISPNPLESFTAVAFSRDGRWLAAGTTRGNVELCDVASSCNHQTLLRTGLSNASAIRQNIFNNDGTKLAARDDDGNVSMWSLSSHGHLPLRIDTSLNEAVDTMAFDSTGRLLVCDRLETQELTISDALSGDNTKSGEDLFSLDNPGGRKSCGAISSNGVLFAILDKDRRTLQIYPIDIERTIELAERWEHRRLTTAECKQYLHQPGPPSQMQTIIVELRHDTPEN